MLTLRDDQSSDLFAPWEFLGPQRRQLLERSWAGVFRDYLLQHLPVKEPAAGFRDDFGRPSKDLSIAVGALILQQLHDLTDQQTTEAVALNIAWHYALDVRHEPDASLWERTLRNYRRRTRTTLPPRTRCRGMSPTHERCRSTERTNHSRRRWSCRGSRLGRSCASCRYRNPPARAAARRTRGIRRCRSFRSLGWR